jgi:hemolysin activation/secretion protein
MHLLSPLPRKPAAGLICAACACALGVHAAGADASAAPTFDIAEFRVLGNHVLAATAIERAVYPFLGANGDMQDVQKAADALQGAYKDAGFGTVLVDIPEQQVDDGVVRLRVLEGKVDRIRVRGARYFSGRQILAALPALKQNETPNLPAVQQQLTALNARTGDRSITPVLKAGAEPGTVDVDLTVQEASPLHASIQVDDRHTADTTPTRATAAISYSNLWQRQDSISVLYQTAPANTRNAQVLSTSYTGHAGGGSGLFAISYLHTNSNVAALGTLGVLGKGSIYGAHWQQPIVNDEMSTQSFNAGLDYKDVTTEVSTGSGGAAGMVSAPVRYINWSATYSGAFRRPTHSVALSLGVGFGVNGLANSEAEFENARYSGNGNNGFGSDDYFYVRLSGEASQALPAGFAAYARWSGQWTESPLVNNEQFSLGGIDSIRGYLEAETLGDSGLAGSLELHTPQFGVHLAPSLRPLYAFVFVDGGVATLNDPLAAQPYRTRLWSTGVGLRLENASGFSGDLDYAVPQVDGTRTQDGGRRIDFSFKYVY